MKLRYVNPVCHTGGKWFDSRLAELEAMGMARILTPVLPEMTTESLLAEGNFVDFDPHITDQNFPMTSGQEGLWQYRFLQADQSVSPEVVIEAMRRAGNQPAQCVQGLKIENEHRRLSMDPIILLGSRLKIGGKEKVIELGAYDGKKSARLVDLNYLFDRRFLFLEVHGPIDLRPGE